MNRYNLKKRDKLFLPDCKILLSKEGLAYVRKQCKIYGGLTPKWYRGRIGTIISITSTNSYLVAWSSLDPEDVDWTSKMQEWADPKHLTHYRPRRKRE